MSEPETEQQDEGTEAAPEPVEGDEEQEGTTLQPLPEPAEEPEEEQQQAEESQARVERISKQLDRLSKRVTSQLGDILGDDAPFFETCEICSFSNTPGMRPSGPLPPEVQAAVYTALGQKTLDDLQTDPHSKECDECGGKGIVRMPSEVDEQKTLTCVKCKSLGWLPTDASRGALHGTTPNGVQPQAPESAGGNAPQATPPAELDPRVRELQAEGYAVIPPYVPTA